MEPVQTGYPWQLFHNASQNTLEEVPFYLGWRAGTEAVGNERAKATADGVTLMFSSDVCASLGVTSEKGNRHGK